MEAAEMSGGGGGGGGGAKPIRSKRAASKKDRLMLRKQTLEAAMEQFRQTFELLSATGSIDDDDEEDVNAAVDAAGGGKEAGDCSSEDEFFDLLQSKVECPDFLEKLECAQASVPQSINEEGSSWDMVNQNDLFELQNEDYVLVREEDIVDGIACFMASYLLSLEQTKDLTTNQIQEVLSKTFSAKKKKGLLRKAWDGSKVIYNVASWGATAVGIYQNPALLSAASMAFWSSCRVISKLF